MQKRIGKICLLAASCLCAGALLTIILTSRGIPTAEAAALTTNKAEILFDGEKIEGLKDFSYNVSWSRRPSEDEVGVMNIKGSIAVHPNSQLLNDHMDANSSFDIILSITQQSHPQGQEINQFALEGCRMDNRNFNLNAEGYAVTTYAFTAQQIQSRTWQLQ
jgi:hypothetical protein